MYSYYYDLSLITEPLSSDHVKANITKFDKRFHNLKNQVRECLENRGIAVKGVADALTSLSPDDKDEHKQFLESHVTALFNAANLAEMFGIMNFNWNYLSYQPLDHLIEEFNLNEMKGEMEAYKEDLQQFRGKTPLTVFCETQNKRQLRLDPEFQEMVAKFDWPDDVVLEVVEQFRQKYAFHYRLRQCAMLLSEVCPGSFTITWFIPKSIIEKLRANMPRALLKKYSVTELRIAGRCVYRLRKHQVSGKSLFLLE